MPINMYRVLSLLDVLNLFFTVVLIGFMIRIYGLFGGSWYLYLLYSGVFVSIFYIGSLRIKYSDNRHNIVFILSTVVVFVLLYGSIGDLLPTFVGSIRHDRYIDSLDQQFFGISTTILLQGYVKPWLTEILYVFYFVYFALPIILVMMIYIKRDFQAVEISLLTLFINYYGAYIAYFYFPVEGPRYFIDHSVDLHAPIIGEKLRDFINFCEPSTLDCFPSLHTSILITCLFLSYRYYKSLFSTYVFFSVVIIFSLIYLRYHYLLDIIVGILWAILSFYVGLWIFRNYQEKFQKHLIH